MKNGIYNFDSGLDGRQIYNKSALSLVAREKYQLAAFRYDIVQSNPHVDLIMHDNANDRIILAMGLPLIRRRQGDFVITWADVFKALPEETIDNITTSALKKINTTSLEKEKLYPQLPLIQVYGAEYSDLTDERCCPGIENYWVVTQHMKRYIFAAGLITNGKILDVASGSGYGATILLSKNREITSYTGADYDDVAIGIARKLNFDPRCHFYHGDFSQVDELFDWIISLETIEHVPDPDLFFSALKTKLAPGGRMLISLPCERWHGSQINRHHWSNWNFRRIRNLVAGHFDKIEYYCYQRPSFGESPFDINEITEFNAEVDVNTHEGYLVLLESPRSDYHAQRIVLKRKGAAGDVLLTTPVIKALRQKYPQHRIVVWTDVTEIFADNPYVDLLICGWSTFQPGPTDIVVDLDEAYERNPQEHILAAYAKSAKLVLSNPRVELYLARFDYANVRKQLISQNPQFLRLERVIAIHMSTTHDRTWPQEYWNTLLQMLLVDPELGIVALGAGRDFNPPDHPRIINLVGRLDLRGTAAAIAIADLLVGMDSSLLHVAGAVGTPAIGLYGLADPDKRAPFDSSQQAIQAQVPCAGCLHDLPPPVINPKCQYGTAFCNDEILPNTVYKAVLDWLLVVSPLRWKNRLSLGAGHWAVDLQYIPIENQQAPLVEKIRFYEKRLELGNQEIKKLKSDLSWLESNPIIKIIRRVKSILK